MSDTVQDAKCGPLSGVGPTGETGVNAEIVLGVLPFFPRWGLFLQVPRRYILSRTPGWQGSSKIAIP